MNLPNWLTVLRMAMVPFMLACYYLGFDGWNYWAGAIFIAASLTDLFDGMIARKRNLITNFGKLMDPIADKVLFMSALLMLVEWGKVQSYLAVVLLAREFLISGVRLVAAAEGVVVAAGMVGKLKTVSQLVGVSFIFLGNPIFNIWNIPMGEILIYVSVVLSVWSCIEYIYQNRSLLREKE